MPVDHKRRLCFVHIPKTGGVSICKALDMEELAHNPASHYRKTYPYYKVFCVIRGAAARRASSARYHNAKKDKIKDIFTSLEIQQMPLDHWIDSPCDYYLRFEYLQKDFNKMLTELGQDEVKLPHLNRSE